MIIGRWSEFRVVSVDHSEFIAMKGVAIVRLGEEGLPWDGRRVGELVLRRRSSESVSASWIMSLRYAAAVSEV